ncbi:MAG: diguanylate cyclase [Blastocatellia bacterium]|nr:diguanylate cyclase [Blastocatellia bacterium]
MGSKKHLSKEAARKTAPSKGEARFGNMLIVWLRLQKSLAEKTGLALVTLGAEGEVVGQIENDNSICQAMRDSAEYAGLCAEDCGTAYSKAIAAGRTIEYRCHAGLQCFAVPATIERKQLVALGGRAFTSVSEYSRFLREYEDFDAVHTGDCLGNIKFADIREVREAAALVASALEYNLRGADEPPDPVVEETEISPALLDAHLEVIRLADQLEDKNRSIAQFYDFLRSVASTLDSQKVYFTVLSKFSEIMKSERSSLLILNEQSNELALEASVGPDLEKAGPVRVKLGEGIAGAVIASGTAMMVRDIDSDRRVTGPRLGQYKTKSFISFPITLGRRKVGVINLADRADGCAYTSDDLSLLELMAPHLALIIDRTEWHKKAEAYQQMSLTDPLTELPNRRYLEERLFEEVERSKRHQTALSFMIIDVDHFKSYNDIYGHTNADRVLVKTAQTLRRNVRAIDMSARFAGDEFCIVLPETELDDAGRIAERLRKVVNKAEYRTEQGELMGKISISIGVSSFNPRRQTPLAIIETADRALYQAKMHGRNCVAVYEDPLQYPDRKGGDSLAQDEF